MKGYERKPKAIIGCSMLEYKLFKETCGFYKEELPEVENELNESISKYNELPTEYSLLGRKYDNMEGNRESKKEISRNTKENLS